MKAGTNLEKVLESGKFAVTAEAGPPRGAVMSVVQKKGEMLKSCCDALNVTDNQTAIARMSSISGCIILKQLGAEPVMQIVCRDRNRIAIQSDVLGAVTLGIGNILCLTGDHHSFGNHPTAKNVHDLDSLQLVRMVKEMRDEHHFQSGDEFKGQEPRFFVGAAANPFGDPFDFRPHRLAKKVKAGADFIQTQLIYNLERFAEFMEKVRELGLHEQTYILAGIGPLKSPGMARYMRDQVPGLDVPDAMVDRMTAAAAGVPEGDKKARGQAWREEGIKIAIELIKAMKKIEGVAGVHVMAIEWESAVRPIVEGAGLSPRPELKPLPEAG